MKTLPCTVSLSFSSSVGSAAGGGSTGSRRRVALVGCGFIAAFHVQIIREIGDVELVAACDPVPGRAEVFAREHGIPKAVTSIDDLAHEHVDVAHLLVPPDLHARMARALLEAGIGVLVEKPLTLDSAEASELDELARARGLPFGVNHNALFHPSFARLLERVRSGEIGRVEHVQVNLSVPLRQLDAGDFAHWMFREPRNIVFEQGPHPFTQIAELVGGVESAQVSLLGTRELHPGQVFHDRWLCAAQAERGTVEVYLAFGQAFTRSTLQVLGSDGSLQADLFHNHLEGEIKTPWLDFWNSYLAGRRRGLMLRRSARHGLIAYLRQTLGLGPQQGAFYASMRDSIRGFHAALDAGRPVPADGAAGVRVLQWCEAVTAETESPVGDAQPLQYTTTPARPGEVLVLGASGALGRKLVARLMESGFPVTAAVRRLHSLPPVLDRGARSGEVRLVRASLEDATELREAVAGVDVVVHLATGAGTTWEAVERAMVRGTRNLGEAALEAGVSRLVFVSTTAALYLGPDCGSEVVSDDVPTDPQPSGRPLYARGKIAAEKELGELVGRGLNATIVRPAVVLDPDTPMQHSGLGLWVQDNHCVGWGRGERPCPLVLGDDVADALLRLVGYSGSELDGKAMNLAARVPLTAADVVDAWRAHSGRAVTFHPRPLALSQTMEIGKWLVKKAGRRKDAEFPSWRDLKSRSLWPALGCERARDILGWQPVEDRDAFLAKLFNANA